VTSCGVFVVFRAPLHGQRQLYSLVVVGPAPRPAGSHHAHQPQAFAPGRRCGYAGPRCRPAARRAWCSTPRCCRPCGDHQQAATRQRRGLGGRKKTDQASTITTAATAATHSARRGWSGQVTYYRPNIISGSMMPSDERAADPSTASAGALSDGGVVVGAARHTTAAPRIEAGPSGRLARYGR
jgi:hypothetical protein